MLPDLKGIPSVCFFTGVIGLLLFTIPSNAQFSDVYASDPYYDTVQRLGALGIANSCGIGYYYCPTDNLTRGDAAQFLIRAWSYKKYGTIDGFPAAQGGPFFDDVPVSHPQYRYIQKLYALGVTSGCYYDGTVRKYCLNDPTSNWSMAVFTTRMSQLVLGHPNYNNNVIDDTHIQASSNLYFPADMDYLYPLYKLVQNSRDLGVIAMGCAETAFCPGSAIRRAEASYYVTRGLLREFLALHAVTSNSGGVWEPAAASGVKFHIGNRFPKWRPTACGLFTRSDLSCSQFHQF